MGEKQGLEYGLLVEMVGIPGAGKSYVSESIAKRLDFISYPQGALNSQNRCRRALQKVLLISSFTLRYPTEAFILLRSFRFRIFHAKVILNWLFVFSLIERRKAHKCLVLDQGIAQAIWSTQYRSITFDANILFRAVDNVMKGSGIRHVLIVHVTSNIEQTLSRLNNRCGGGSPIEAASRGHILSILGSDDAALNLLLREPVSKPRSFEVGFLRYMNSPGSSLKSVLEKISEFRYHR